MAHFMGTSPRLLWFSYGDPAALATAFGFFLLFASTWLDFSSIHWSSFDFLKRQRFPSLKAGIFCSPTYLYSVSGLTPRYCEAWRIFITSRASAIIRSHSTELAPPTRGKVGREFLEKPPSSEFR